MSTSVLAGTAAAGQPAVAQTPRFGSARDEAAAVLAAAVLAPSIHNSQPWRFTVVGDRIALHLDRSRCLPVADASLRGAQISCGAALFNLRLAVAVLLERRPLVTLLPDADDPDHLADVRLGDARPTTPTQRRLFDAISRRQSTRRPMQDGSLDLGLIVTLIEAVKAEGARLEILRPYREWDVQRISAEADQWWTDLPAYRDELASWTSRTDDGVPAASWGPQRLSPRSGARDFGLAAAGAERPLATGDDAGQLVLVATDEDRPVDRMRAGQALQRMLLEATSARLSTGFLDAALESDQWRWLLRDPRGGTAYAQSLVRLGWLSDPTEPQTPRRPLDTVVDRWPD